jgi:hypothetical protein
LSINQPLATIVSQDFVFSAFSQPIRVSLIHELAVGSTVTSVSITLIFDASCGRRIGASRLLGGATCQYQQGCRHVQGAVCEVLHQHSRVFWLTVADGSQRFIYMMNNID